MSARNSPIWQPLVLGSKLLDVSNPERPLQVGGYTNAAVASAVHVLDHYVYLVQWGTGVLHIIDVGKPALPTEVGTYGVPPDQALSGVWVEDHYAYLVGLDQKHIPIASGWLKVMDVSEPAKPRLVAQRDLEQDLWHELPTVAVAGTYAYMTTYRSGLAVFDVSEPTRPTSVASLGRADAPGALAVSAAGHLAAVAQGNLGLALYRVTPALLLEPRLQANGSATLYWHGGPGIRLQKTATLSEPSWQDIPNSEGAGSREVRLIDATAFFHLVSTDL